MPNKTDMPLVVINGTSFNEYDGCWVEEDHISFRIDPGSNNLNVVLVDGDNEIKVYDDVEGTNLISSLVCSRDKVTQRVTTLGDQGFIEITTFNDVPSIFT